MIVIPLNILNDMVEHAIEQTPLEAKRYLAVSGIPVRLVNAIGPVP